MDKHTVIKNFLDHASKSCVTDPIAVQQAISNGGYIIKDWTCIPNDKKYLELRKKCHEAIFKKTSSALLSEKEIDDLLADYAIRQFHEETDQTNALIRKIEATVSEEILYVVPNYAIELQQGVDTFSIGPITCVKATGLPDIYDVFRGRTIRIENEPHITFAEIPLSPQVFCIDLSCSKLRSRSHAEWQVDIGLSIFRMFMMKHKLNYGFVPHHGALDPYPFVSRPETDFAIRVLKSSGNLDRGSLTRHPLYEIYPETIDTLNSTNFNQFCDLIFNAGAGTLAERFQRALGWMSKARRSDDLATKFLFFFTAIEAFLSQHEMPITETISRHLATLAYKVDSRHKIYKRVKELYRKRSKLVHSGERNVTESDCNELQYLTELLCRSVYEAGFDIAEKEFFSQLNQASFGTEWPSSTGTSF